MKYYAGLASWLGEAGVRWVRLSKSKYQSIELGASRMIVWTHPGRLGYEWFERYDLER